MHTPGVADFSAPFFDCSAAYEALSSTRFRLCGPPRAATFSQSHFMLAPNLCFAAFYLQRSCLQCLDGSRCQMVHAAVSLCQCSRCLDLLRARLFGAWVQHRRVLGLPAVHFRRRRVRSGESRASNARLFEYNVPITVALSPTRLETRMGSNVCSNKHLSCLKPSSFETNYCFRQ